jgi:hypothetical protein
MQLSDRLNEFARISSGTARFLYESASSACKFMLEDAEGEPTTQDPSADHDDKSAEPDDAGWDEDAELAELAELGQQLEAGDIESTDSDMSTQPEPTQEQPATAEPNTQEPVIGPEQVNQQPEASSVSADALIKELISVGYPEKIRVVAQQMKQQSGAKPPTAGDMTKNVAEAISRYMSKKGYAALPKEDCIRVVKTIIMAATDRPNTPQK